MNTIISITNFTLFKLTYSYVYTQKATDAMRLPPSQLPFHSFFNLPYEYFNQSFCLNLPKRVFSLNSNVLIKIPPSKNQ